MIFLDQPVGVGFSYADHEETVVSLLAQYYNSLLQNEFELLFLQLG